MNEKPTGYRTPARLLHWAMALLVFLMIPAGVLMVREGIGRDLQNTLFIFHKNVGVLVLLLLLVRFAYRRFNPPPPLPAGMPAFQARIAAFTHGVLYTLLFLVPVAGYVRVRAGGFPIEALDAMGIPALVPRSESLAAAAKMLHYAGGIALAVFVAMHVGAALFHGIVKRDGVFVRMWPPISPYAGAASLVRRGSRE